MTIPALSEQSSSAIAQQWQRVAEALDNLRESIATTTAVSDHSSVQKSINKTAQPINPTLRSDTLS